MRETITTDERGRHYVSTLYDSLDEMADAAVAMIPEMASNSFTYAARIREAARLAHVGWNGEGDALQSLDIISSAVRTSMAELNVNTVVPSFDVVGGTVDLGRYFAGDPECMLNFPLVQTSRAGKVIRLCASVDAYAGVSLYKRGLGICALVQALSETGHAVELYLDVFCNRYQRHGNTQTWGGQIRCLVKAADDTLDMSKVMFGYAYNDTMRSLGIPNTHRWPKESHAAMSIGGTYGNIGDPTQDLPEGTLYIPHAMHGLDLHPEKLVKHYLIMLGLADSDGTEGEFKEWNDANWLQLLQAGQG